MHDTSVPFQSFPGKEPTPIRWWQWRRKAARLAYLERVVHTEIRIALDGTDRLRGTFENAYETALHFGGAEVARGIAVANLLTIGNRCPVHDEDEDPDLPPRGEATVKLRLPLDVVW